MPGTPGADEAAAEPQWLDDAEQRTWRAFIDLSSGVRAALEQQLRRDEGLSLDDYEVLVRLSEADGRRLRMSQLAADVTNSPSRLSQRIDRMARDGLVARERVENDGRGFYAVLTESGLRKLETAAPGHLAVVRSAFVDRLSSEELEVLGEVLGRLSGDRVWEDGRRP